MFVVLGQAFSISLIHLVGVRDGRMYCTNKNSWFK